MKECDISALLAVILNGFGLEQGGDNQLMVRTSVARFAQKKNDLLQAMLAVDDLFQSARASVRTFFIEDVTAWLESHDIRNVGPAQFAGQRGFHHTFDFVIPKSKAKPERVL